MFALNPASHQPDLYKRVHCAQVLPRLSLISTEPTHQFVLVSDHSFSIFIFPSLQKLAHYSLGDSQHIQELLILPSDPNDICSQDLILVFLHTSSDVLVLELDQQTLNFRKETLEDQSPLSTDYNVFDPSHLRFNRFESKNTVLSFSDFGLVKISLINYSALPKREPGPPEGSPRLFQTLRTINLLSFYKGESLLVVDVALVNASADSMFSWIAVSTDGSDGTSLEIEESIKFNQVSVSKIYIFPGGRIHKKEGGICCVNEKAPINKVLSVFMRKNRLERTFLDLNKKESEEWLFSIFNGRIPAMFLSSFADESVIDSIDVLDNLGNRLFGVCLSGKGLSILKNDFPFQAKDPTTRVIEQLSFPRVLDVWVAPSGPVFGFLSTIQGGLKLSKLDNVLKCSKIKELPGRIEEPICFVKESCFFIFDQKRKALLKINLPKPQKEKRATRLMCQHIPGLPSTILGVLPHPSEGDLSFWVLSSEEGELGDSKQLLSAHLFQNGSLTRTERLEVPQPVVKVVASGMSLAAIQKDNTVTFCSIALMTLEKIGEMTHHRTIGPVDLMELSDGSLIFAVWVYNGLKSKLRVARITKEKGREVNQIDMSSLHDGNFPVLVSLKLFAPLEQDGSLSIYAAMADGKVVVVRIKEEGFQKIESIHVVSGCSAVFEAQFPSRDIGLVQDGLELKVVFGKRVSCLEGVEGNSKLLGAFCPLKMTSLFVLVQKIKGKEIQLFFVEDYEAHEKKWVLQVEIWPDEAKKEEKQESEPSVVVSNEGRSALVHFKRESFIKKLNWTAKGIQITTIDISNHFMPNCDLQLLSFLPNGFILLQRRLPGTSEILTIDETPNCLARLSPALKIDTGVSETLGQPSNLSHRNKFVAILTIDSLPDLWVVCNQNELKLFNTQTQEIIGKPQPTRDKAIFAKNKDKAILVGLQKYSVILYEVNNRNGLGITAKFSEYEGRSIFFGGFLPNTDHFYWGSSCFGDFFITNFGQEAEKTSVARNLKNSAMSRVSDLVISVVPDHNSRGSWSAIGVHGAIYSFETVFPDETLWPLITRTLAHLNDNFRAAGYFIDKNLIKNKGETGLLEETLRSLETDTATFCSLEAFLLESSHGPSLRNLK